MTTQQAFKHLTSKRGWYAECKIDAATARSLKRHFIKGKISIERMEALLKKAGYKKKPESWSISSPPIGQE